MICQFHSPALDTENPIEMTMATFVLLEQKKKAYKFDSKK